jgi:hypothetical protein
MHAGVYKRRKPEKSDFYRIVFCLHIPDPYESLIRYYSYYSNASRGKRKKLGLENGNDEDLKIEVIDDAPSKKVCRKSWSQLIYKIYEVDPLKCPRCGSEMTIIAFIQGYQKIKKILKQNSILFFTILNCFSLFPGYFHYFFIFI